MFSEVYKSLNVKKVFEINTVIKIAIICVTNVWFVVLVLINCGFFLQAVVWLEYHKGI